MAKRILFFLLVIVASLGAQERIVFDSGNKPYMYEGAKGAAVGIYPTVAREVLRKAGVGSVLVALPWRRAVGEADAGLAALGGCYSNTDRLARYDFTDPIYTEQLMLIVMKGKEFKFNSVADLKGKKVGTIGGWTYGDTFDTAARLGTFIVEAVANDDLNLQKLEAGRVDCIIIERFAAERVFKIQERGMVILPTVLATNYTYIAWLKTLNKKEVIAKFNVALKAMKADGSYDKLVGN